MGEKLVSHIGAAETRPEWAAELPQFVSWIREFFGTRVIRSYLGSIRRFGIWGSITQDGDVLIRRRGPASADPYNPIDRDLKRLQRAKLLLLDAASVN